MKPLLPSATPTWHNDTYAAISPKRAELNAAGKVVVITGAGGTIGGETALAFAEANAKHIVLLGRTESSLRRTQERLPSHVESSCYVVDIVDEKNVEEVAGRVGAWDVLVMCAGYQPDPKVIEDSGSSDWWRGFEINVKGPYNTIKIFTPHANPAHASVVAITSAGIMSPASVLTGLSSYVSSKLAQAKLLEFLGAEHPNIFTVNLHPGFIYSDIFKKSGVDPSASPMDAVQLPAHTIVWLVSPEARFLNGKTVWANWDVDELLERKDELVQSTLHTVANFAFPYRYPEQS